MPIDPRMVKWEEEKPDASAVQWEAAPEANNSAFAGLITGRKPIPAGVPLHHLTTEQRRSLTPAQRSAMLDREEANRQIALSRTGDIGAVANYFDAIQHHGRNWAHGLAQLGVHGLEAAGIAPAGTAAADDRSLAQSEADYQQRTAGSGASYAGAAIGEVAPWLIGVGELRAAGVLPKLRPLSQTEGLLGKAKGVAVRTGLLGAEGGLMSAATPVTEDGAYAKQKGAQIATGAVAAPLLDFGLRLPGVAYRGGRAAIRPFTTAGREEAAGRELADIYGNTQEVLAALNKPGAAGYQPSAAQAIGTPEAIQAERRMRNDKATSAAFAQAHGENNKRLLAEARDIAGTPEKMIAAKAARNQATAPTFAKLEGARVDPLPVLKALDSLSRSGLGQGKNVAAAVAEIKAKIHSQIENGTLSGDVLSGIRERASSYLGPMASAQEKKALAPIRDSIVDALDASVPGYRDSLGTYARLSGPIRGMEAGRTLVDAITSGGSDALGGSNVTLNQVNQAIKRAQKSQYGVPKETLDRLLAMRDALQQRSISSNTIAATGPASAADLMSLLQQGQGSLLQRSLRSVPVVGPVLAEVPGLLGNDVRRRAGAKAVSAKETAKAIEAYNRRQAAKPRGLLDVSGIPQYLVPFVEQ